MKPRPSPGKSADRRAGRGGLNQLQRRPGYILSSPGRDSFPSNSYSSEALTPHSFCCHSRPGQGPEPVGAPLAPGQERSAQIHGALTAPAARGAPPSLTSRLRAGQLVTRPRRRESEGWVQGPASAHQAAHHVPALRACRESPAPQEGRLMVAPTHTWWAQRLGGGLGMSTLVQASFLML